MDHSNVALPQTFYLKPNCSKCQKMAKRLFSTVIGSVSSIKVEDEGDAGVKVSVTSTISPNMLAAIIGETMKKSSHKSQTRPSNQEENNTNMSFDQNIFKGHQGPINLQELAKTNKIKHLELVQNLRINFNGEKVDNEDSPKESEFDTPPVSSLSKCNIM